jgi:hypothetical protein
MMFVRRRPLLRAAAIGGTAYAVGRSSGRQREQQAQAEYEQDQRISNLEQQQAPPAPPAPPAPAAPAPSMLDQLNQLASLHEQGALTDEEFTAAKAKLLGS